MKRSVRVFRFLAVGALAFFASAVTADTTLTYAEGTGQNLLRIAGGKVRFDGSRDDGWLLFDAGRDEMTFVDPERGEYTVVDEATLQRMQAAIDAVMTAMATQLAEMPPSMRDQMGRMMGGMLPDHAAGTSVRLEATGEWGDAAGYECSFSRVLVNQEVRSEVCLASAATLGLPADDRAAVDAWQGFARQLAERASRYVSVDVGILGESGQVPVILRQPDSGPEAVLEDVSGDRVDPSLMRVPDGFRVNELELPFG